MCFNSQTCSMYTCSVSPQKQVWDIVWLPRSHLKRQQVTMTLLSLSENRRWNLFLSHCVAAHKASNLIVTSSKHVPIHVMKARPISYLFPQWLGKTHTLSSWDHRNLIWFCRTVILQNYFVNLLFKLKLFPVFVLESVQIRTEVFLTNYTGNCYIHRRHTIPKQIKKFKPTH